MAASQGDREGRAPQPGAPAEGERELFQDEGVPEELKLLVEAARERNARDAVVLDLREISNATDFFYIASGESDVHARAIARNVQERLEEEGYEPAGVEGESEGNWILLDYFDIVAHVFLPRVRDFYQLEQLWGDAPRTELAG